MRSKIHQALLCAAGLLAIQPALAEEPQNILSMSGGAVLLSHSGEYTSAKWCAMNMFDGDTSTAWCSPQKAVSGTFLIELAQRYRLERLAVDSSNVQEQSYPGISARTVEVWGSTTSDKDGFTKLATITGTRNGRTEIPLKGLPEAQWLKLVILDNYGHREYTELNDFEAYGQPVGKPVNPSFTGTFSSNWGPIKLQQNGYSVVGCYTHADGRITGSADGHVLRFDWVQRNGGNHGTAIMVLNSAGNFLNGAWYGASGSMGGAWTGNRDDSVGCNCQPAVGNAIGERLIREKRVIAYGIHFDSDSAKLKPQSEPALNEILEALKKNPSVKVRIEGHTDSTNTDQYNLSLSQKRSQSVAAWLAAHGVSPARLTPRGLGEAKPVADNLSPQGRALNRRVEIAVLN